MMSIEKIKIYLHHFAFELFGQKETIGIDIKVAEELIGRKVNKPSDYLKKGKPFDGYSLYGGTITKIDFPYVGKKFEYKLSSKPDNDVFVFVEWLTEESNLKIVKKDNLETTDDLPENVTIEHIEDLKILPKYTHFVLDKPVAFSIIILSIIVAYNVLR